MKRILANLFLFIYILSPIVFMVLFGTLVGYGGRVAEGIGAGIFAIIICGHLIALVTTVRVRKHSKFRYVCFDTILLTLQLLFTIIGIITGILNALDSDFQCSVEINPSEDGNTTSYKSTTESYTFATNDDSTTPEIQGKCVGSIFLFIFSVLILYIRWWISPIMERVKRIGRNTRLFRDKVKII